MTLDEMNRLPAPQAKTELLKCCGSTRWASLMCNARPFADLDTLIAASDETWQSLDETDWLEAFRAHPKIGEQKAANPQSAQAQSWSAREQAGVTMASRETKDMLAKRNREYEQRFRFIFIVCASGKSSEEMLEILNSRIGNNHKDELRIAADEQRKITRLRLEKLLSP